MAHLQPNLQVPRKRSSTGSMREQAVSRKKPPEGSDESKGEENVAELIAGLKLSRKECGARKRANGEKVEKKARMKSRRLCCACALISQNGGYDECGQTHCAVCIVSWEKDGKVFLRQRRFVKIARNDNNPEGASSKLVTNPSGDLGARSYSEPFRSARILFQFD